MKLEKKDIAEALGLTYIGEKYDEDYDSYWEFGFNGKAIKIFGWHNETTAWEEASNEFLKPLENILFDNL